MMKKKFQRVWVILMLLTLVLSGCSLLDNNEPQPNEEMVVEATDEPVEPEMEEETTAEDEEMEEMTNDEMMEEEMVEDEPLAVIEQPAIESAVDLRVALTTLLGEHVLLASSATGAALDGRDAEFTATVASLDANSVALSELIAAVYGDEAGNAFLGLWRSHIGLFVDYTNAVATGDESAKEAARANLADYGKDFSAFLGGANPNIDTQAVEANLAEHVITLTAVIDAQGANNPEAEAMMLRHAYGHMSMTGLALSTAIAQQFPDAFPGEAGSPAGNLRTLLNALLAEHTYLAAAATNAALNGRGAEFQAYSASLDKNTQDLGSAIGAVYGKDAETAFVALWRSHIGFFVDYTLGVASDNQDQQDQAVAGLLGYRADFIAFLTGANPNLSEDSLTPILTPHVSTLTTVIDAQGEGNWERAYEGLRVAYAHMQHIADPLSGAIVAQFPDTFPSVTVVPDPPLVTSQTPALDLRTTLTNLLGEHVLLASAATGSALDGRTDDFNAAASALDDNSVALSEAVASVYGEEAGNAFLGLWRTHINFFVSYTNGVATDDEATKQQALTNLEGYGDDFAAFLSGANPEYIDPEAIKEALAHHVDTVIMVIDAQGAGDQQLAYTGLRHAYDHMSVTGLVLSDAIVQQFPNRFEGQADTPAGDLRITLNTLLAEHTFLAAMATDSALGGRDAEFEAAVNTLDANTLDLGSAIGSVYGDEAEEAFVPLWRSHIGFFVDYTTGVATVDVAMKDQAIDDLLGYRADFIAFLSGANPALTEDVLTPILTPHVGTLTAVIDAQGANDAMTAYTALREAYAHMQQIADPLAEAIVQQFPDLFLVEETEMEAVPITESDDDLLDTALCSTSGLLGTITVFGITLEIPAGDDCPTP